MKQEIFWRYKGKRIKLYLQDGTIRRGKIVSIQRNHIVLLWYDGRKISKIPFGMIKSIRKE